MKIQPPLDPLAPAHANGAGTKRADAVQPATPAVDQVHLSTLATQGPSTDASSYDAAKVSEIKQAIAEGRLTVDASVVADRLIAQAMALASKDRG